MPPPQRYNEVLRVESFSAGIYRLDAGSTDAQAPHREAEVYLVVSGTAEIEIEGNRRPVSTGSLIYVAKGVQHRSVDIAGTWKALSSSPAGDGAGARVRK